MEPISPNTDQSRLATASLLILAGVALATALSFTRSILIPFTLALFLAYLIVPIVDQLHVRLRLPKILAVAIALLFSLALIGALVLLLTSSIVELFGSADIYRERLLAVTEGILAWLTRIGFPVNTDSILSSIRELPFFDIVQGAAGTVVHLITNFILVLIFIFFLINSPSQEKKIKNSLFIEIDAKVRKYIILKFTTSALTGLLVWIALLIFGLHYSVMFGVLTFLLNFIPTLGSIIATLLPIPIALIQFENPIKILWLAIVIGVIQMIIGNGIEPKIFGKNLDLHPVTVVIALVFWGLIWGIAGMFLAVPITAVLKIILDRIEGTRALAELMAGRIH